MKFSAIAILIFAGSFLSFSAQGMEENKPEWKISNGQFDISDKMIKSTGRENFIWRNSTNNNFEISFKAKKAPNSDFRINVGSSTPYSNRNQGSFYQILVPWEGGDTRIDYFNEGRIKHIASGFKNIEKETYQIRLVIKDKILKLWIEEELHLEFLLSKYEGGYFGFGEMQGVEIHNFKMKL